MSPIVLYVKLLSKTIFAIKVIGSINSIDLYQVRYFLTIAETGNFSQAAERLYLSQPSLSKGIKKLEQELSVTLFERGGRRTVLTAAGRSFLEKATVIMEQLYEHICQLSSQSVLPDTSDSPLHAQLKSCLELLDRLSPKQNAHSTDAAVGKKTDCDYAA